MKKSLIIGLLTITATNAVMPSISADASVGRGREENIQFNSKQEKEALLNELAAYVEVSDEGLISLSDNIPDDFYQKYNIEALKDRFKMLNENVLNGNIKINSNLSIEGDLTKIDSEYESEHSKMRPSAGYRTHGRDTRKSFWWGVQLGYCQGCTKECALLLRNGVVGDLAAIFPLNYQ